MRRFPYANNENPRRKISTIFEHDFLAVSSVPDAFVKFSQLRWAQKNRLQMEGESRGRPVKNCSVPDASVNKLRNGWRRRGRCCGASVGTTGSAPSARSRPRSVVRGLCWNKLFRPLSTKRRAISSESDQTTKIEVHDFASVLSMGTKFKKFKSCIFSIKTNCNQFLPILQNAHFRKRSLLLIPLRYSQKSNRYGSFSFFPY